MQPCFSIWYKNLKTDFKIFEKIIFFSISTPFSVNINMLPANCQMECLELQSDTQLKEFDRVSLHWTFTGPIFPEINIPCFTITPYSRHHYLAASVFVSNYFQERNTLRVKLEPKYLMSTLRTENCNYFYQTRYWWTSFSNTMSNIPLVSCCPLLFYFYN